MTTLALLFIVGAMIGAVAYHHQSRSVLLTVALAISGVAMVAAAVAMPGNQDWLSGLGGIVLGVAIITSPPWRKVFR